MTIYPANKQLSDYSLIFREFRFHLSVNRIVRSFPVHRHDFLECSLVLEGEGHETVNGITHKMEPGTFTFLLPHQVHEIAVLPDKPIKLFNCMFDAELLTLVTGGPGGLGDLLFDKTGGPAFVYLEGEELRRVTGIFADLQKECLQHDRGSWCKEMIRLKLTELLISFGRCRRNKQKEEGQPLPERHSEGAVWPVIQYIETHYREDISLKGVAALFGVSAPYLSSEIKKRSGLNFLRLLHTIRIQHACGLLLSTSMTGMDIAVEVGFNSYKAFMRIFKEHKSMTPGEYRRENRRNAWDLKRKESSPDSAADINGG